MKNATSAIKKCADMPSTHAKAFTVLLTISFFILFTVANLATEKEIPVLLLTFAVFIGSSLSWIIASNVKKREN